MKIRWLTSDFTTAEVTRGMWPWRESALVERVGAETWQYAVTRDAVEWELARWLDAQLTVAVAADRERRNWTRKALPRARLVKP